MARTNGSDARATVAVIGTRIMGSAMTRNLAASVTAGHGRQDISAARLALASGSPAS